MEFTEFTYVPALAEWAAIAPELIIVAAALVVLLADLALPARQRSWLAAVGLVGVLAAGAAVVLSLLAGGGTGDAFFHMVTTDGIALLANAVILLACGLTLLLSPAYVARQGVTQLGEYYALVLLATAGMMLMASATNLMTIFVGLELLSLALYILSAYFARRFRSQEAGMKYFLLSSFASGFLLYGMALTYGSTGATSLTGIRAFLDRHPFAIGRGFGPLLAAGLALLAVGFCFKVAAVPFHAWTPDVYVGAPTTITAFMSVGTKVAAFVALARTFLFALHPASTDWQSVFWGVAVLTMIGGNVLAVTQTDVKRMLAYSSVAHAGYILVGIATGTPLALSAILVYLATYAAMNIGAFGVVLALEGRDGQGTTLADYAGLARRRPVLAGVFALCLFSLAGIPPTAGFIGKWDIFYAAIVGGRLDLAIIGLVASVLGMFYYLRVIWAMYFTEPIAVAAPSPLASDNLGGTASAALAARSAGSVAVAEPAAQPQAAVAITRVATSVPAGTTLPTSLALAIAAALTLGMGIVPGPLFQFAQRAAEALLH